MEGEDSGKGLSILVFENIYLHRERAEKAKYGCHCPIYTKNVGIEGKIL